MIFYYYQYSTNYKNTQYNNYLKIYNLNGKVYTR